MMLLTTARTISMGHRLPFYNGICSSLHGHNVKVQVTLDNFGVFIDFKDVDAELARILEPFDHAMVLLETDNMYGYLVGAPEAIRLVGLSAEPTTENIAYYVFQEMAVKYSKEMRHVEVFETAKYSATANDVPKNPIRARYHDISSI